MLLRRFLPILLGLAAATAAAQETVEIDNPWVRVLRVKQEPHAKTVMLPHPASVTVYLTGANQRFTGQDGKAREAKHKAGDVAWADAGSRAGENLSGKPLEMIRIELKPGAPKPSSPAGALAPGGLDPVRLDPKHHIVVLENDRVRALRTILEPHLKSPMHEHPHYVVVYITELHTTQKLGDGKLVDNPRKAGDVAWRDALQHETENIGARTAVEIQVELK